MAQYVIRKIAYHYSDENLYEAGEGGIENVYDNHELAYSEFRRIEVHSFRSQELNDIEPLGPCCGENQVLTNLHEYFLKTFNSPLITQGDDYQGVQYGTKIPSNATDEQIWEIKELTGIRFYTFSEFAEGECFYQVVKKNRPSEYDYFYNTKEEAIIGEINSFKFKGSLEDISNTPSILEDLIKDNKNVTYLEDQKSFTIGLTVNNQEEISKIIAIISLIKPEIIRLEELSIDDAREIDHYTYEEM